jgi:ABC-type nitrate/sulfonate/bicarbonate transport system substrate-binding protein
VRTINHGKGHRRRRLLAVASLLTAVSIPVAACSSSGSTSSSPSSTSAGGSAALIPVTIGYVSPVPDHLVPAVTLAAGLFAKYGLKAKVVLLSSGSEYMTSLASGQVQLLSIPAPTPELAAIDGAPIEEVAQLEDSFDAMMVSRANYPTVSSLNGKTIAISYPGDFGSLLSSIADQMYNIKLKMVPIGPYPDQVAAFESGEVDSIPALQPVQLGLIQQKVPGTHMLIDFRTIKNVPAIQLVGYGPWLQSHRSTAVKMLEAINAGFAFYKNPANESLVLSVIEKSTGDTAAVAEASYKSVLENMTSTIVPTVSAQANALKYLALENPKAASFNAGNLVDASYATAATTAAGS